MPEGNGAGVRPGAIAVLEEARKTLPEDPGAASLIGEIRRARGPSAGR